MAKKLKGNLQKSRDALRIYNTLTSRYWKQVKKRGLSDQISYRDVQKIVSSEVYPFYRGAKPYKLRMGAIDEVIVRNITQGRIPKRPLSDTLKFYRNEPLWEKDYFMLDPSIEDIRQTYPNGVELSVNAGSIGSTGIFNSNQYSYAGTGVREVVEGVRDHYENEPYHYFRIRLLVKDGRKDDGMPDSYFVEIYLDELVSGQSVQPKKGEESDLTMDTDVGELKEITKKRLEEREKAKLARDKEFERKEAAKKAVEGVDEVVKQVTPRKGEAESEKIKKKLLEERKVEKITAFNEAIKNLRELLADKLITKKQFKEAFDRLTKNLEAGGKT